MDISDVKVGTNVARAWCVWELSESTVASYQQLRCSHWSELGFYIQWNLSAEVTMDQRFWSLMSTVVCFEHVPY